MMEKFEKGNQGIIERLEMTGRLRSRLGQVRLGGVKCAIQTDVARAIQS